MRDLEYPKLELVLCKRGVVKLPPGEEGEGKPGEKDEVIAYVDGVEACEPCLTIRIDHMQKGEYYVMYRPDFKPWHIVKRLNIVFYSEFMPYRNAKEQEIYAKEREIMLRKEKEGSVMGGSGNQSAANLRSQASANHLIKGGEGASQ